MSYKIKATLLFLLFFILQGLTQKPIGVPASSTTFIQEAIQKANPHDTIFLPAGVYLEHDIVINKPLSIVGEKNTIIDGGKKGYIFKITADSVSLSGLTLKNVGQSYTKDYAAIYISKSKHYKLTDLVLEHVFFGMLIEKSKDGIIKNNLISSDGTEEASTGNGIHLWHCSNVLIEGNETHHMRDGIYFEFVDKAEITNNYSHNNLRYGLHFMFSNEDNYHHNIFSDNGAGVAVMFSKFIKMTHNTFIKNWGTASYGLLLKEIYDAEIEDNIFQQNTIAINLEGSTRINYKHNDFLSNGWALKVTGACYENKFFQNNFSNNTFDVSYNSQLNDNDFSSNYWSSNSAYDLDKDGVGDVPYRPVKLFSYIVNKTPETIILLRSLFVDIINFSEKVSPVFTPDNLVDNTPLIKPYSKSYDDTTK